MNKGPSGPPLSLCPRFMDEHLTKGSCSLFHPRYIRVGPTSHPGVSDSSTTLVCLRNNPIFIFLRNTHETHESGEASPYQSTMANPQTPSEMMDHHTPRKNRRIKNLTYLEGYENSDLGKYLMELVAELVIDIIERWQLYVVTLAEFYPKGEEHVLGQNVGQGKLIELRLRAPYDEYNFLPLKNVLSSLNHELVHNMYSEHDGDFYAIWNSLNSETRIVGEDALWFCQNNPLVPQPSNMISLTVGGKRVYLDKGLFGIHFPLLKARMPAGVEVIKVSRRHDPSAVVRLIQIAKGLDPGDCVPLECLPNYRDYWDAENSELTMIDSFWDVGSNNFTAISLYVEMYIVASKIGMHASTKNWLLEQFSKAFAWDWRRVPGPWKTPYLCKPGEFAERLCKVTRYVYHELAEVSRPLRGQCLRDVAAQTLQSLLDNQQDLEHFYQFDKILAMVREEPEIERDIRLS